MRCRITNHHHHALTDDFSQFYSVVVTHRPCKFSARSEESARAICDRSSIRNERGANARVNREREKERENEQRETASNTAQHSTIRTEPIAGNRVERVAATELAEKSKTLLYFGCFIFCLLFSYLAAPFCVCVFLYKYDFESFIQISTYIDGCSVCVCVCD